MVVNEVSRGRIEAIHTSPGGVPKHSSATANVIEDRLEGDDHDDKKNHGGPDRAVCLYSLELIEALKAEGHPIFPGSTGENVTVAGIPWGQVVPGSRFTIGSVELQVTGYASPCKTIRESFLEGYFNRISQKLFPGWSRVYARVIGTGPLQVGDEVVHSTTIS
jgi:MOSC domain-containing protein YiiM